MNRIIYQTDDGGVAIIVPSDEYLANHTIEELATKDVPAGKTYHIIDTSAIPTDRKYRSAWEVVNQTIAVNQAKVAQIDAEEQAREELHQSLIAKLSSTLTPEETALLEELL